MAVTLRLARGQLEARRNFGTANPSRVLEDILDVAPRRMPRLSLNFEEPTGFRNRPHPTQPQDLKRASVDPGAKSAAWVHVKHRETGR
jgi:hypothetical protein